MTPAEAHAEWLRTLLPCPELPRAAREAKRAADRREQRAVEEMQLFPDLWTPTAQGAA